MTMRTRGQPAAVVAVQALLRTGVPQAILLVGPAGVGKTTLAEDLAAALACAAAPAERPCDACRGCRLVRHGNHPDVHRLSPDGAAGQIGIGRAPGNPARGVRDLVGDLALMPVEAGHRIGIIEAAHRMNEDAQSALLKTLEEPPDGVVLILCTDDEERILPTVRSRAARIRLGSVPIRDIEALLEERGVADPPTAARLARLAAGRPGLALAYAGAPEAVALRAEIARTILDMTTLGRGPRLAAVRDLLARSADLRRSLDRVAAESGPPVGAPSASRGRQRQPSPGPESAAADGDRPTEPDGPAGRVPAADRRRAAQALLATWIAVARDLAVVVAGAERLVVDLGLLDDLRATAGALGDADVAGFVGRARRMGDLIDANVSPELAIDSLVLAWPTANGGPSRPAAGRSRGGAIDAAAR